VRVLLVAHRLYPERRAGTEVHAWLLARALARDHEVAVFAGSDAAGPGGEAGPPALEIQERDGVRVWWLRGAGGPGLDEAGLGRLFGACLDAVAPEVVHVQHLLFRWPRDLGAGLLDRLRARGLPAALSLHDFWWLCPRITLLDVDGVRCPGPGPRCGACALGRPDTPLQARGRTLAFLARRRAMAARLEAGPVLLPVSQATLERYVANGVPRERCRVVRPGIAPLPPLPAAPGGALRIAFLGSLVADKGVHVLLEAASRVPPDIPLRLTLHGPGGHPDYVARLRRQIAAGGREVAFAGSYDHAGLPAVLAGAHVVVLPSLCEETAGLVLLEARAAGRPVVASRVGGIPESIRDGEDGRLVPPGDPAALAAALVGIAAEVAGGRWPRPPARPPRTVEAEAAELGDLYAALRAGGASGPAGSAA
jgi:glycosyltransferase involved in cell wall biosynthesis